MEDAVSIRRCSTAELSGADLDALRALFAAAWPDGSFTEDDFTHGMAGPHWLAAVGGRIVSHVAYDARVLEVGGRPLRTGYLEAVATLPAFERRAIASRLVRFASDEIRAGFELGGLSHRRAGVVRAARLGDLARADVRAHDRGHGADRGRRRLDPRPAHSADATPRPLRAHQLRLWRTGDVW